MVVVISSMALTPVAVELALKIAGPTLDLSNCEDTPTDQMLTTIDEADGFGLFEDFFGRTFRFSAGRLGETRSGVFGRLAEQRRGSLGGGGKW